MHQTLRDGASVLPQHVCDTAVAALDDDRGPEIGIPALVIDVGDRHRRRLRIALTGAPRVLSAGLTNLAVRPALNSVAMPAESGTL